MDLFNFLLVFITYIVILIITKTYISDYISKFVLVTFGSYWCFSLGAAAFSPYGIFEISTFSFILLLAGVIAFTLGMCSIRLKTKSFEVDMVNIHRLFCQMISSKWILLLYLISILYLYKYAMYAIAVATLQGHADTTDQLELIFQGNSIAQMVYGYFLMPLFHVSLVLMSYCVLNIKKYGFKYFIQLLIYFVNLLIFIAIGGGRSTIVIVGLYLLITYVCLVPKESLFKISYKKILYVVIAIFLVVYAVSLVTNYRNAGVFVVEDNSETKGQGLELLIRYSLLPYVLFDHGLQNDYLDKFGYQFGKATFLGFDNWIYIPMKVIGYHYEISDNIVQYLEDTWIQYDKSGTSANYAYTGLMYHYLDFGIVGVVLFPFLFGNIFRKIILSLYKRPLFTTFLLLSMCFFLTMHSVFTCYLIKGWTGLYLVTLFFMRIIENNKYVKVKGTLKRGLFKT